jgi:hypothetical protein
MRTMLRSLCALTVSVVGIAFAAHPQTVPISTSKGQLTSVTEDPLFQKLMGPSKQEEVFLAHLIEVKGLNIEIGLKGTKKRLVADLSSKTLTLSGLFRDDLTKGMLGDVRPADYQISKPLAVETPFDPFQLSERLIEDRPRASSQVHIYRESGLLGYGGVERDTCLKDIYQRFYRGWLVQIGKSNWFEHFYFFYAKNSDELLAVAAVRIDPAVNDAGMAATMADLRKRYEFSNSGPLENGLFEQNSMGSIWSGWAGEAVSPLASHAAFRGIKKLWISPSWAAYANGIFEEAKAKWLERKQMELRLDSKRAVIEVLVADVQKKIEGLSDLESASLTLGKLWYLADHDDQGRIQELDARMISALTQVEEIRLANEEAKAKAKADRLEAQQQKERTQAEARADAPKRIRESLCEWYRILDSIQKQIADENEIQAASGITDMRKRYGLGQNLVMAKRLIQEGRAEFRKLHHREFDRARDCK